MQLVGYKEMQIPIYWHNEAKEIIFALASRYAHDVTPVSKGGKGRNTVYYYNRPAAFDIETTTIRPGELDYYREDGRPIAFAYLYQFCIYDTVIMCRMEEEARDIFNWISAAFIGGKNRVLIMFDHNLGYEYGFCASFWDINGKKSFAIDEHHPVTIQLENGIMLRDSYKMTNMSLETLTRDWSKVFFKMPEIMNYNAQRTPYTDLDKNTILYSALDVLSLAEAMPYFLEARGERIWTSCPTSTSFIRAELKRRVGIGSKNRSRQQQQYFRTLDACKITGDIYSYLRRQVRGGNTHANRRYTGQMMGDPDTGTGVYHADITSSYPAQMVCYPEYPIKAWEPLDADCPISVIEDFEANGYCTLFDIVLVNPVIRKGVTVPYIPMAKSKVLKGKSQYSDNGRYLRGAEWLKITIFGIEWNIIKSQYIFDDTIILGGYFAEKGYLPDIIRKYVIKLYAQKTKLKGVAGKEIEYALTKTYVNGVFGMAYTSPLHDTYIFIDERIDKLAIKINGINIEDMDESNADYIGYMNYELNKYQRKTSYFLPYAWGAMVATLGRVYLQKMIDAVGEDFIYCDTDSIFAIHPEESRRKIAALESKITKYQRRCGIPLVYTDIKGRPHELGGIGEEPECAFMTYGAKKYITVEPGEKLTCTIAGVPKKAGSKIIGNWKNFRLNMVFRGKDTNKLCLWYNPDEGVILHDPQGREIRVHGNIAMLPVNYILSLSDDYTTCLYIEGINKLYQFKEAQPNQNEEYV